MNSIIKDVHLRKVMVASLIVGIYPLKVSDNIIIDKLYTILRHILIIYFSFFVFSMFLEIIISGSSVGLMTIFDNLGVSLLYLPTLLKILKITGVKMMLLVEQIRETEKLIFKCQDKVLMKIFADHAKISHYVAYFIYILGVFTVSPFFVNPYIRSVEIIDAHGNVTSMGALPFSAWYPFDKYKYYYPTVILQIFTGIFGCSCTVIADAMFWSSMLFPIALIKILHHKLTNFKQYSLSIQNSCGIIDSYQAQVIHLKICVILHRIIRTYVKDLNEIMNQVMLLDFLICSIQMGISAIRIFMDDSSGLGELFAIEYLLAMLMQMFVSYWFANELIYESSAIPGAIWASDWVEFPRDIQRSLFFIAAHSKNPLTLNVGPFYPMSTDIAISIVKAAYSCVTLIRQTYGHEKK